MNTSLKQNQDNINAQPIELGEMPASSGAGANLMEDINPLHQVKTTVQVCVGTMSLSIGELMTLKAHQVVRMQQAIDAPVDLLIEGKPVARGQLVAVEGQFAIRITELPVALQI